MSGSRRYHPRDRKPSDASGHQFEREILGISGEDCRKCHYVEYDIALIRAQEACRLRRFKPKNPETPVGHQMYSCVKSYLDLYSHIPGYPTYLAKELEFYPSVGTELDYYHGVDFFFKSREFIVTVDISCVPKHTYAVKADLNFTTWDLGNKLWQFCNKVAKKFETATKLPSF